jgi:hypothetical protein
MLGQQTISHASIGRFRSDVLYMDVAASAELAAFCTNLHS